MPEYPLESVSAYADRLRFDEWPFAGSLWDQPSDFVDELRTIHLIVEKTRERERKRQQQKSQRRR